MHDVKKLIESFNALVHMGHSLIVIEHNTNLIKQANHIMIWDRVEEIMEDML